MPINRPSLPASEYQPLASQPPEARLPVAHRDGTVSRPGAARDTDHLEPHAQSPANTSLRPLSNAALQAVATTGALVTGLALAARSTYGDDPLHNRPAAAGGALAFALASGIQLGAAAQERSAAQFRGIANRLLATGLTAMGAAQLQGGLDGRGHGGITAGSMAIVTGLLSQLTLVGIQLRDDQRAYGNVPVPQTAPRGSVVASVLASASAAMAVAGTTLGLRARGAGDPVAGFGWLSLSALASLPLLAGMAVGTRARAVPREEGV